MRTRIELDDALLAQVQKLGRFPTRRAAVNAALAEYANLLKRRELLALRGEAAWEGDLDRLRRRRDEAGT